MPNLVDGLLVTIVIMATYWGWRTGALRQLVAVSGTMVAFTVAEALFLPLGGSFNDAALSGAASFFQGLSYLLVMFFVAAVWFVHIRRIYPYTRLGDETDARICGAGLPGWHVSWTAAGNLAHDRHGRGDRGARVRTLAVA